jgi:hypothetical protein
MSRKRDWCKLDEAWYAHRKLRRILRDYGPVAGAYWSYLIARSYADSHHEDNPQGAITTTLRDMSDDLYDQHDRMGLWDAFVTAGLITMRGKIRDEHGPDLDAEVIITLADFGGWQWPKGAPARRQAASRYPDKNPTICRDVSQVVTEPSQLVTQIEKKRESKREITSPPPPVERPPAHVRARPAAIARADDEVAAVASMTEALTRVADEGTAAGAAEALMFRSSKRHPSAGMILPLPQWVAAVDAFVAKVESGWTAPAGLHHWDGADGWCCVDD